MPRQPRDYQIACIQAVKDAFAIRKLKRVVAELFTGAGKGYIIANIAEQVRYKKGRVLVLVNRDNLCDQLVKSLVQQGLHPKLERGLDKASPMSELVVGSVQSMNGQRLKKWHPEHFRMVITDEVHFGAAKSFKDVLEHFRNAFHLGITATLDRHDKKGLWDGYQDCVFSMPLTEGISEGWLVPLSFKELPVPITILDKENKKKSFNDDDEENIFKRDEYLPRLFAEAAKESHGRKALHFWPGCKASEEANKAFQKLGLDSRHIDGYMAKSDQQEILNWYAAPGPKVLHNAELLSYGYDNPSIDCIGIMRLSKSIPMLKQRIGRGTRPYNTAIDSLPTAKLRREAIQASEKPKCLVLDLMLQLGEAQSTFATSGNLITTDKAEAEAIRLGRKSGMPIDLEEMANLIRINDTDGERSLTRLAEDAANAANRKKYDEPYYFHILKHFTHGKHPATQNQMRYLKDLGYKGPDTITSQQCMMIINVFKEHKAKTKQLANP